MPNTENPVEHILREQAVFILDGALATELERHGCNLDDPLWSARVLMEKPELIYQVHLDYFRAGADCAITSSYQASVAGFKARGLTEPEALNYIRETVELAKRARDDFWNEADQGSRSKPLVAASVGPYGAYLADGSEYVGNYGVSDTVLADFHRDRMEALLEAGADILAFETIPSLQEASVLAELLVEFPEAWAWLSFSMKDAKTISDRSSLAECAKLFSDHEQIAAIGLNCAPTEIVTEAIGVLKSHTQKPIIVYPNSGETYDLETRSWQGREACDGITALASEWHATGARLIGGCCRTTPEEIAAVARQLRIISI